MWFPSRLTLAGPLIAALIAAVGAGPVHAGEADRALRRTPDIEHGRVLFKNCEGCHLPQGWGVADGTFPQIAGQHRTVIIKQLSDVRDHLRDIPAMMPFASPAELGGSQAVADVAAYVATLPPTPDNGVGPGDDLTRGRRLYAELCADCHGPDGEGNPYTLTPRLQGQHFGYLLRQFQHIRTGNRGNADLDMRQRIRGLSDSDAVAILDYLSRHRPPTMTAGRRGPWTDPDLR